MYSDKCYSFIFYLHLDDILTSFGLFKQKTVFFYRHEPMPV